MRKLKWILLSAASLLSLGCVHKTLTDSAGPEPGEEGTVHIFVQCTQVRNLDLMDKATFVLSNLYARKDGRRVKIPFAGSVQGNILTGDILSYELYAHGESSDHTLTLLISTKDGRYILKDMDVSDQMLAQKAADEIYLVIDQEIDLADDGSEGLKPGEEGVVHIFVNCLNVSGLDQVSQAAYGLSNLRARKGGEPVTLPFAADIRNGVLAGDVLSYGHCAQGETCQHTLSLFVRLKDGTDKLIEIGEWMLIWAVWLFVPLFYLWQLLRTWCFRRAIKKDLTWYRGLPYKGNLLRAHQVLCAMRYRSKNTKNLISACVMRLVSVGALRIEPLGDGSGNAALVIGPLQRVRGLVDTKLLRKLHDIFTEAASDDGILQLDDVSFTANSGEILGIAGISGNGQKELLEAIAGLQNVSAGIDSP